MNGLATPRRSPTSGSHTRYLERARRLQGSEGFLSRVG